MRDITHKSVSLRTARAVGFVSCPDDIIDRIRQNQLPKGNLLDIAKASGLLASKQTHHLIPHCHPVAIDSLNIDFQLKNSNSTLEEFPDDLNAAGGVAIIIEGKSIGRTGIEMEVLTAVSVTALTIYDLLKPLGQAELSIGPIRLLHKSGGKSDRALYTKSVKNAAVLVCSDSTATGKREDKSGRLIQEMLQDNNCHVADYQIVPDDPDRIRDQILQWTKQKISFIFTTGGTGLGPRDNTVDTVRKIIEKDAPGIVEAMRNHGGMRTPVAMMSRSVAGSIGESLIITLPGSTNGVRESLDAILPVVFHAKSMLRGNGH